MTTPVMVARGLSVHFGGITAVDDVTLACSQGAITGLIGPNGAGKTTFVDAVTGFLPKNARGSVQVAGAETLGLRPHQMVRRGLARTWQGADLFGDVSVRGNLEVAAGNLTFAGAVKEMLTGRKPILRVEQLIEDFDLTAYADKTPWELPAGDQRWIGIARAMASNPSLLLLDEPAAGLNRAETLELADKLRSLRDRGHSILLIDHDMGLVLNVCDQIHVLDFGRLVASGTPREIQTNATVIQAYLGDSKGSSNEG